jgi:hypothetical protein
MTEKGYLVERDDEEFVQIHIDIGNGGSRPCPFARVAKEGLEIQKAGNIVATMQIGVHPEPALTHLFKHIHSEIVALERAKKSGSLYVRYRAFA